MSLEQHLRFPTAGFEIRVPGVWTMVDEGETVSMRGDGSSLTIRVGEPDGQLLTCGTPARPWERCRDERITDLDEFRQAVEPGPPEGCGWCIPGHRGSALTVDGEDAWQIHFAGYEYPAHGAETALYVLAIHDGRPYFLRFHSSAERLSPPEVWGEIVKTFVFLDGAEEADAWPEVLLNADIELSLPEGWRGRMAPSESTAVSFSSPEGDGLLVVGEPNGRIRTCLGPAGPWESCELVTAGTLADLAKAVEVPGASTHEAIELDGEPAQLTHITAPEPPAHGGQHVIYVLAVHDGQPLILRFHTSRETVPESWIEEFLTGFRFTSSANVATDLWEPHAVSEFGMTLELPGSWTVSRASPSVFGVRAVAAAAYELTISRYGPGEFKVCSPLGRCLIPAIGSVEDLADAVIAARVANRVSGSEEWTRTAIHLGSLEGIVLSAAPPGAMPISWGPQLPPSVHYLVAFPNDQSIVIRWNTTSRTIDRILETMAFEN